MVKWRRRGNSQNVSIPQTTDKSPFSIVSAIAAPQYTEPYVACAHLCYSGTLETAEQYNQLKAGSSAFDLDIVHVTDRVHADILKEPAHFRNASYHEIAFLARLSRVRLYPLDGSVDVYVDNKNAEFDVPDNYSRYAYNFDFMSRVTDAYVDSILKCKNATSLTLEFRGHGSLATKLFQRIDELRAMTQLRYIALPIGRDERNAVALGALLTLPALERASIRIQQIDVDDYEAFMAAQQIPSGWQQRGPLKPTEDFKLDFTVVFSKTN